MPKPGDTFDGALVFSFFSAKKYIFNGSEVSEGSSLKCAWCGSVLSKNSAYYPRSMKEPVCRSCYRKYGEDY
ncbi:hypothetical protein [Candidatus Hecatella orcuttiae]|uniref:hypothetical protein n=1 Tax=Candidatus Hecatella orcuttiae TaxID=1935119 RepID=UPI002867C2DD|nr:hypothetical protein [Candidatus Hecatella orcuttiae]